ncbi:hypothetical protein C0992_011238 [Termitomyces sp. T32_za158]|nr:hypothetical protein C0992_011238 [Termitomyces sp. T32_za158]
MSTAVTTQEIMPPGASDPTTFENIMSVIRIRTRRPDSNTDTRAIINDYNEKTSDEVHPLVLEALVQIVLASGKVEPGIPDNEDDASVCDANSIAPASRSLHANTIPATTVSLPLSLPRPTPSTPPQTRITNPYWHLTQLMPGQTNTWLSGATYEDFWSAFERNNVPVDERLMPKPSVVPGWPSTPPPSFPRSRPTNCVRSSSPARPKRKAGVLEDETIKLVSTSPASRSSKRKLHHQNDENAGAIVPAMPRNNDT